MLIKRLIPDEWKIWKNFRLMMLKSSAQSFGSSYEEEAIYNEHAWRKILEQSAIFGAFEHTTMVGSAGFYQLKQHKTHHRGGLFAMYVVPEFRRMGVASLLIKTIIEHSRTCVIQIHLSCVTSNTIAVDFYKKNGFEIYGTEPRSLQIKGKFFDEYLMALKLDNVQ